MSKTGHNSKHLRRSYYEHCILLGIFACRNSFNPHKNTLRYRFYDGPQLQTENWAQRNNLLWNTEVFNDRAVIQIQET